jgi:hypothetical protein
MEDLTYFPYLSEMTKLPFLSSHVKTLDQIPVILLTNLFNEVTLQRTDCGNTVDWFPRVAVRFEFPPD